MVVDPLTGQAVGNGVWDSIKGIISTPGVGLLGLGALQGISSFISGATSTLTPAQVELYRAQAQQNLASSNLATQQADMLTLQRQNMGGNLPVATRTPVTGAPVPSGLINSTPPRPAPVTGQVA